MMRRALVLGPVALIPALLLAGPATGQQQDAPESLLPPGFGSPAPSPAPSAPAPAPTPRPSPQPGTPSGPVVQPLPQAPRPGDGQEVPGEPPASQQELDEVLAAQAAERALPPGARRSLSRIGVIGPRRQGFEPDGLGRTGGPYLNAMLASMNGEVVSRWGQVLLRRALASRIDTPQGVNGANFAAERAALLLRMGEADAARMLVQQVDPPRYTPRLREVALQAYLATADLAGFCPVLTIGEEGVEEGEVAMLRAICAAFAGDQSNAGELIDRASRRNVAQQFDLLLAEKLVGGTINGRRAVRIDWNGVGEINPWRFGTALSTGVEPPAGLLADADPRYQLWRVRAPMLSLASRIEAADLAAARGVLSHQAMIDLYSAAYDAPGAPDDLRARGSSLRNAYVLQDPAARIGAMRDLWGRSDQDPVRYASQVLTARAAARFPVNQDFVDDIDGLIAAMLAGGYDRNARAWSGIAPKGGRGWAMLQLAEPEPRQLDESDARAFLEEAGSGRNGSFWIAALAGLGRVSNEVAVELSNERGLGLSRESRWTRAIDGAAQRGDAAMVAILMGVGMQGDSWTEMSPRHLYHILRALRTTGLNAEARMIAAEAIART